MLRSKLPPARVAERAAAYPIATAKRSFRSAERTAALEAVLARGVLSLFKVIGRGADYPIVRKSALIYVMVSVLSAAALAGIGDWAGGGSDASAAAADSPSASVAPGEYASNHAAAELPPLPPVLPSEISKVALSTSPGYTIRRTVPEVRLQFTVADEHGRLVQDLSADDLSILEDQSPVAKFEDFARDDDLPLRLGIVLDVSDSVKRAVSEEKVAALEFLDQVLHPQTDSVFVMAFGGTFQVWQGTTTDRASLVQAVNRVQQPGWGTVLFDALYSACVDHLVEDEDGVLVHRAIVVLSDGNDTFSLRTLPDVIAAAQRREIQIYALTVHKKGLRPSGDAILRRLADETGGVLFVAQSAKELQGAFAEIEQEMRTQYYVSFPPQQSAPGFHALRVEVHSRQKLQVHARQGYYAAAP